MISNLPKKLKDRIVITNVMYNNSGCWRFTGKWNSGDGYSKVRWPSKTKKSFGWRVHRLTYTLLIGEIPYGLVADHLCQNRWCCNPAHLQPMTSTENTRKSISNYISTRMGKNWKNALNLMVDGSTSC